MELGTVIKELRTKRGMSQGELAWKTGLSQTALSQIENNEKHPRTITIKKICKALQVTEVFLYLLAVTEKDVSKSKRRQFNELFPTARHIMLQLFNANETTLSKEGNAVS